ncbi:MAG: glycoside hydrolase family 2 protein, partial [Bacteroidota bacterium]
MLKTGYIIIVCAFLVLSCKEKNNTALLFEKELDTGWQFNREGSSEMHPATVPGCVHTDLLSIGLIEDPFTGENEKKLQWIEKEIWEYSCRFMLDPSTLNSYKHYELVFDGLDTYAKVYLNNRQILTADNMFRVWTVDCSDLLKETNDIRIEFLPADSINSLKESEYPCKLPDKRAFTRKAPYQ